VACLFRGKEGQERLAKKIGAAAWGNRGTGGKKLLTGGEENVPGGNPGFAGKDSFAGKSKKDKGNAPHRMNLEKVPGGENQNRFLLVIRKSRFLSEMRIHRSARANAWHEKGLLRTPSSKKGSCYVTPKPSDKRGKSGETFLGGA